MCGIKSVRNTVPALLAIVFFSAAACGRDEKPGAAARITNFVQAKLRRGPILKVESSEYTNDDLTAYLQLTGGGEAKGISTESLSRIFDRFVDEKIMLEAARRRNLTLTWDEKKSYLARRAGETEAGAAAAAAEPSAPDSVFDGLLVDKYAIEVVKDVRADEADVRAYYDLHKKDFLLPERVQVSQILVPSEQRAVAALRIVENAPEEQFRKTAREQSSGPEAFKGGVMGVYRQGDLPYDMEKVIFALDEGKVSRVVESSYGYHIFRLDRRFPPQLQPLSEAAPAIRIKVLEQKIKDALAAHLAGLKDTLNWKVFPANLFFSYQRLDQ